MLTVFVQRARLAVQDAGRGGWRLMVLAVIAGLAACQSWRGDGSPGPAAWWDQGAALRHDRPVRLNNASPWYPVDEEDLAFYSSWCGWDVGRQERVVHLNIHQPAKRMILEADRFIVASVFLFDNLYGPDPPMLDLAGQFTELLVEVKRRRPEMTVVVMLDLMHKAWSARESIAVRRLREAGVDVFYADLLEMPAATRWPAYENTVESWHHLDWLTWGMVGRLGGPVGRVPLPLGYRFDGEPIRLETVLNAAMFKANHRKLLITGTGDRFEALVTSANPHNASVPNENHAIAVRGPVAAWLYMVCRENVRRSIERGGEYCDWSDRSPAGRAGFLESDLPALPDDAWRPAGDPARRPRVMVATERAIEAGVLAMLERVGPGDQVRIQMFYLARVPVVHAILDAAGRTDRPVRLLLDSNRVGLGYPKDGTPNAQVADFLLDRARREGLNLQVRWYATRGEQNHAKIMSVTNAVTGKYQLTTGSANWTRKNLAGVNMEANIFVDGSVRLNGAFDMLFDRLWDNRDPGMVYSVAWDDAYRGWHRHRGRRHWAHRPRLLLLFPMRRPDGRPVLVERELVHW